MNLVVVVCLALFTISDAVNPERARSPSGHRNLADCTGVIGFSATGVDRVHESRLISFKSVQANTDGGFQKETGEYTASCPGFYFVSFASYPKNPSAVILKKRGTSSREWQELVRSGASGGSNQMIVQMAQGDQIGLFAEGQLRDSTPSSSSFSAFILTRK